LGLGMVRALRLHTLLGQRV
jgi:hypothetical protein